MEKPSRTLWIVLLAVAVAWVIASPRALANSRSLNVVIIGGSTLDRNAPCANYSSAANVAGGTAGGCLALTDAANEFAPLGDLSMFNFTPMTSTAVNSASLASYDTAVLMMASSALACNSANLSAQAKADIVSFIASGKKLIIYDPECVPGPNYSWLPFPFVTANPGATGSFGGTLTIVEENTLSKKDPASPYYIDTANLTSTTDAVGDMNVMTTYDPNWSLTYRAPMSTR